jgi:hypothetical protein
MRACRRTGRGTRRRGPLGERLEENIPTGHIEAPLLIAQGLSDDLVLPSEQEKYVQERCRSGQRMEYRTYEGFDHVGVVLDPSSPLVCDLGAWTQERFDGVKQPDGCRTVTAKRAAKGVSSVGS